MLFGAFRTKGNTFIFPQNGQGSSEQFQKGTLTQWKLRQISYSASALHWLPVESDINTYIVFSSFTTGFITGSETTDLPPTYWANTKEGYWQALQCIFPRQLFTTLYKTFEINGSYQFNHALFFK